MEKKIEKELTITRVFNAPRPLVWEAWTKEEHIREWWGPKGFTNPVCQWNAEAGKGILIHMRAPDGVVYPMDGTFTEIIAPEKIVFTSGALDNKGRHLFEITNIISFIDEGDKTKIILHFEVYNVTPEAAPHLAGMETGWNMSLDKLTVLLGSETKKRTMSVSRVVNAPRELVFDVWTDPEHIKHWWGPVGFTNTIHKMDVRPGGEWVFVMHAPDGADYPNKNTYIVVDRPNKIVLRHEPPVDFTMTAIFEQDGDKTRLTISSVFDSEDVLKQAVQNYGAEKGLAENADRLQQYVEKMVA